MLSNLKPKIVPVIACPNSWKNIRIKIKVKGLNIPDNKISNKKI